VAPAGGAGSSCRRSWEGRGGVTFFLVSYEEPGHEAVRRKRRAVPWTVAQVIGTGVAALPARPGNWSVARWRGVGRNTCAGQGHRTRDDEQVLERRWRSDGGTRLLAEDGPDGYPLTQTDCRG